MRPESRSGGRAVLRAGERPELEVQGRGETTRSLNAEGQVRYSRRRHTGVKHLTPVGEPGRRTLAWR